MTPKGLTLLLLAPVLTLSAQIDPSHNWRTIRTQHFYVHFTPPTESLARRIAADAERAYTQLSRDLHPPRGMIDVVVTDDTDQSNGSATPAPTNRIVLYASPPVSESALRYTNDWAQLVMTHELTHIFHLDRTRGVWALGQHVFGRAPLLFPNLYDPSWLTEGIAVYEESRVAGAGRIEGSEHRMIARAAALEHNFPSIGAASLAQGRFPFGETAYGFGSLFVDYLARTRGDSTIRRFVDKSAANLIPYLIDIPARQAFGQSFRAAWNGFRDSVAETIHSAPSAPMAQWRELTHDGVYVFAPRWLSDSSIVYSGTPGRETFGAFRVDLNGRRTRIGRRNNRSANVPLGNNSFLYSQLEFVSAYVSRSDLWIQRNRREHRLTLGQRLNSPDARADGEIVAVQIIPGATRLVRVSANGERITPITTGSFDEQWTEPRWSHGGDRIVASRWLRGNISQVMVLDTAGHPVRIVSSGNSIEAAPSWLPGDRGVTYSSDRTGTAQVYIEEWSDARSFTNARSYRVSNAATGLFEPNVANTGRAAAVLFRNDGYHLGVGDCCGAVDGGQRDTVPAYRNTDGAQRVAPVVIDSSASQSYSPWHSFLPHYWLPTLDVGIDNGYRFGATTTGTDVLGRHAMAASIGIPLNDRGGIVSSVSYRYSGFGLPVIAADFSRDWVGLGGAFSRDAGEHLIGEVFRRTTSGDLLATWIRPRYRTSFSVTGGVALEQRAHFSTPDSVLALVDTAGALGTHVYPSVVLAAGFANYQYPTLAISPEDGMQVAVTLRDRTRSGVAANGGQSMSVVSTMSLFKSLDLPGFAHHVVALRGAGGFSDQRASGFYTVGGVSGSPFEILPGYVVGEGRKTFPVRGYAPGTLVGTRALTGTAEYRAPLFLVGNSPGSLPFFLDRSSITFFGDYGTAWCPNIVRNREVCNRDTQRRRIDIGSVGAELNFNLGVLSWDSPYRFRIGVVNPVQNSAYFGRSVQVYFVAGVSF
jgi:hypothetical protein